MPIKTRGDKKYHDALVWTCIGLGIFLPVIDAGAKDRERLLPHYYTSIFSVYE
jgi:hypothetical protein